VEYTRSTVAERILAGWPEMAKQFVKVLPHEYRRVLERQRQAADQTTRPVVSPGPGVGAARG
jgi:glutamate synthase domain-containing protein 3